MRRLIVIGLVVFVASVMCAESVATNGYTWTYSVSNGKATVWAVRPSPTGTLNIPASLSGIPLNTIGDSVFQGCSGLAEVTIPDSVSDIGYCAFSECSVLSSVMIPASVTSIGEAAFADCTNLSQVELPNGIGTLSVGVHAFDAATVVNVAERSGYAFSWTNATGEVVADPFHSLTAVVVFPCWQRVLPWDFAEGLAAHYTFDGNANDASGNGNNGTIHGVIPTIDRHGNTDGAYHFNGTSAYIEVPDSDSLREVGQVITMSAWVKPEVWTDDRISILCKGRSNRRQYGVQALKSNLWSVNSYDNGQQGNNVPVSKLIVLNRWNHVVVSYSSLTITAYLNGELVGTMSTTGSLLENSDSLYIGMDPPGALEYLTGDLDEVRIYNRALSVQEVRALSNGDNPISTMIGNGTHVYRYSAGDGIGIVQAGIGEIDSSLNIPSSIGNKSVIAIGRYAFAALAGYS